MTELQKIQDKIKELQEKLTDLQTQKSELESDLIETSNDDTKAQNTMAMINRVETMIKINQLTLEKTSQELSKEQARLSSDEYKKQVKILAKLKQECDDKQAQIMAQTKNLVAEIQKLHDMTDKHYQVTKAIGGDTATKLANQSDYRRAWIVQIQLEKWLKVWKTQDRFKSVPVDNRITVGPAVKGPQWDEVMKMRYHAPGERVPNVKLEKNDPGPGTPNGT